MAVNGFGRKRARCNGELVMSSLQLSGENIHTDMHPVIKQVIPVDEIAGLGKS